MFTQCGEHAAILAVNVRIDLNQGDGLIAEAVHEESGLWPVPVPTFSIRVLAETSIALMVLAVSAGGAVVMCW